MVETQIVQCGGHVHVRESGLPWRLLAKVEIGDRPLREVVNEALDRAEARLLYDEGWRLAPCATRCWIKKKDLERTVTPPIWAAVRDLERTEAKATEATHRATAQRLYDEGWRRDPANAGNFAIRDMLRIELPFAVSEQLREIQETPETQPRWTMTKRQRDAYKKSYTSVAWVAHQKHWSVVDGVSTPVFYGDAVAPHDCPGMRENGPVVFLSSSAAEGDAARKVARDGDYLLERGRWYVMDDAWTRCDDQGLL